MGDKASLPRGSPSREGRGSSRGNDRKPNDRKPNVLEVQDAKKSKARTSSTQRNDCGAQKELREQKARQCYDAKNNDAKNKSADTHQAAAKMKNEKNEKNVDKKKAQKPPVLSKPPVKNGVGRDRDQTRNIHQSLQARGEQLFSSGIEISGNINGNDLVEKRERQVLRTAHPAHSAPGAYSAYSANSAYQGGFNPRGFNPNMNFAHSNFNHSNFNHSSNSPTLSFPGHLSAPATFPHGSSHNWHPPRPSYGQMKSWDKLPLFPADPNLNLLTGTGPEHGASSLPFGGGNAISSVSGFGGGFGSGGFGGLGRSGGLISGGFGMGAVPGLQMSLHHQLVPKRRYPGGVIPIASPYHECRLSTVGSGSWNCRSSDCHVGNETRNIKCDDPK